MKKIVEIHAIQNFAPSNLNRDDTGAPKDAFFGGTRRARFSSQCIKRAIRQHFSESVKKPQTEVLNSNDMGSRTKLILGKLVEKLANKGRDKDEAEEKSKLALSAIKITIKEDGKSEYLLFLGQREISDIADIIDSKWDAINAGVPAAEEGKKQGKAKKKASQNADPALKKALENVFNGGKAVDVALFGRMLADMPEKNQHAACQVAHAISTHSVEREFDYYTAVDDLKPEETPGADMIGTVEFNSACFYRYAVVDWEKLIANLQSDKELAMKGLRAFLQGFVMAEPSGKQNTFAAHNPPEFIAICVRSDGAPRNLANAFETAVRVRKDESLTAKSAAALVKKGTDLQKVFGGDGQTFILDLSGIQLDGFGEKAESMDDLLNKTIEAVKE